MKLIALSFFCFSLLAQAELSSPRSSMRHFLTNMKVYKQGEKQGVLNALQTLPLEIFDSKTKEASGILAAEKLIKIIDKIEYVDYSKIPNTAEKDIWHFRNEKLTIGEGSQNVEIALNKLKDGSWVFTKKTVESLDHYIKYLNNKDNVKGVVAFSSWRESFKNRFPSWTSRFWFGLKLGQWIGLLTLVLLSLLIEKIFRKIIGSRLVDFLQRKNVPLSSKQENTFTFPFGILAFSVSWQLGVRLLEFQDNILAICIRIGEIIFTLGIIGILYHIVKICSYYFTAKADKTASKYDDILVPLISRAATVIVFCLGVILICQSFNLDVTNIIAGLGIGGLAFALAAKDTLSNIFGSLTVILDKPFQIGDWVNIGGNVEGTVEEVGFRSTRVRTFYDSLITVPNNILTNTHIDNFGRRRYRRYNTKVAIAYDTPPEKVEAFCEAIRQLIANHKWTRKDYFHVYLNNLGDSALEIILYVFWETPDWSRELNEKHRLLLDILRLGNELKIEFAFPTQTLHLIQSKANDHDNIPSDIFDEGSQVAEKLVTSPMTSKNPRSQAVDGLKKDELSL